MDFDMQSIYELWFRMAYADSIANSTLNAALRPDDRRSHAARGFEVGKKIRLRVLEKPGNDEYGINPRFLPLERLAIVNAIQVCRLDELTAADLASCAPVIHDVCSAAFELSLTYDQKFDGASIVTLIRFTYIS